MHAKTPLAMQIPRVLKVLFSRDDQSAAMPARVQMQRAEAREAIGHRAEEFVPEESETGLGGRIMCRLPIRMVCYIVHLQHCDESCGLCVGRPDKELTVAALVGTPDIQAVQAPPLLPQLPKMLPTPCSCGVCMATRRGHAGGMPFSSPCARFRGPLRLRPAALRTVRGAA